MIHDDLGHPALPNRPVRRVISLVPSLTEAVASTRPDALVGATDWCTHPVDLDVPRVRGTKNPDRAAIAALEPDLVIANQEENREVDVARLREAGIPVWVTRIESVEESLASMRRLFVDALGWSEPAWLGEAREVWSAPPRLVAQRVGVAVWRDPWMVVGPRTFTSDLLRRLGLQNAFDEAGPVAGRYPHIDVSDLDGRVDLVILPDEPYAFTVDDGPEAFPSTATALVSGRALTWYGPSLTTARALLEQQLSVTA